VTAPSKVVQITCCSTASPFTLDGRSGGYFFRTIPTSKTQAYATASETARRGMKKTVVVYINTDFGTDMLRFYKAAVAKLGGEVIAEVPYNDNQPSYRAEVTRALAAKPESLLLIGFPKDAVTIVREWLSLGGTEADRAEQLDAHHGLRQRRRREVRRGLLRHGQRPGGRPARRRVQQGVRGEVQADTKGPGVHTQYDALMVMALAMNIAKDLTGPSIKDAVRRVHVPNGTPVGTGPAEFKKALELIKAGKPIKYFGATGPIEFDANGDVTGPGARVEDQGRPDRDRPHHHHRGHAGAVQARRELSASMKVTCDRGAPRLRRGAPKAGGLGGRAKPPMH
jgi:branched-chain amino acid transport system substrate-binding protein